MRELHTKDTNPKDLVGQTKANIFLIPPASLIAEAEALMDGARKYDPYNWRTKGVRTSVYLSAAMRHILAYLDGEEVASDSKVCHLGHAKACLGIVLDSVAQGNIVDDRPVKGKASQLLEGVHKRNEIRKVLTTSTPWDFNPYTTWGGSCASEPRLARGNVQQQIKLPI